MPLMIGLMAIAEPLFLFLLTDKWAQSIPYFQLLCLIGLVYPIQVQNYNLFRIKGRSVLVLNFGFLKYAITFAAIALTYRYGIYGLIYGQIAVAFITQTIASYLSGRLIDYSLFDQVKALFPSTALSLVMGTIILLVGEFNIESYFLKFSFEIVIGIVAYYLLNRLIGSPELTEFTSILQHFFKGLARKVKELL